MAFKPGQSGNPAGKPRGAVSKVNREFRDTVRKLLEDNAENVSLWLQQVAATDPDKALDKLAKLAEYAAPKLSRTVIEGDPDNPLQVVTKVRLEALSDDGDDSTS